MERGRDHEIGRERLSDKEYNLEREKERMRVRESDLKE